MSDFLFIPPFPVTASVITTTNVLENDAPAWSIVTAYTAGQQVIHAHRVYEAEINNTGVQPNLPTDPPTWIDLGPTNRFRAFDDSIQTRTERAEEIDYTFRVADVINAVTLFGLDATEVQVTVTDTGASAEGVVYDQTRSLIDDSQITDWYAWFFEPQEMRDRLAFLDLPQYWDATVRVRIRKPGGTARVGLIAIGRQRVFAVTNYGVAIGIQDYSTYRRDPFGNLEIIRRGTSDEISYPLTVDTAQAERATRLLRQYTATPLVVVGASYRPETIVYGVIQQWRVLLAGPLFSDVSLDVAGYPQ